MPDQKKDMYYLGQDPFSGKLIRALFLKKEIRVKDPLPDRDRYGTTDILLADAPGQLIQDRNLTQILLSNLPIKNPLITYWCKTPLNETGVDNIVFFTHEPLEKEPLPGTIPFRVRKVEDFVGSDPAVLKEVIAEFIDNLYTNFRILYQSVACKDYQEMHETAHKMMSSVSYYEVDQLTRVLRYLEDESVQPEESAASAMIAEVFGYIRRLRYGLVTAFF